MERLRKLCAKVLVFCLILGVAWYVQPAKSMASTSWTLDNQTVTVTKLDSDYKDGMYRFNVKISVDKVWADSGVTIRNIRLEDSKGKAVKRWDNVTGLCTSSKNKTVTKHFSVDFSKLSGGTYTFKYTVESYSWRTSVSKSFSHSASHSSVSIKYDSCKYVYDTDGTKKIEVKFQVKGCKGYAPKVQIYDSNNNLIRTFPKCGKISSNDKLLPCTWGMANDDGLTVKAGTYTMKLTVHGKSCCKKIKINPN